MAIFYRRRQRIYLQFEQTVKLLDNMHEATIQGAQRSSDR